MVGGSLTLLDLALMQSPLRFLPLLFFALLLIAAKTLADTSSQEPVCVTSTTVELHKAPSAQSPVSWIVGRNMPLLKVGEQRDKQKHTWFEVRDLDGEKHWVRPRDVSHKVFCTVVRSKVARLRQGPGKEFPSADLAQVDRFTPFKKLDRDGEWVQIEDEYEGRYWAHETNLWIPAVRNSVSF